MGKKKEFNYIIINKVSYINEVDKVIQAINDKKYDKAAELLKNINEKLTDDVVCLLPRVQIG